MITQRLDSVLIANPSGCSLAKVVRIPLPPQPHPREQPNETSDELALTVTAGNFQASQTHPQFSVHPPFREVKNWDAWKIIIIFTAVAPLIY